MNARLTLTSWLVFLLTSVGALSEIIYSGVQNVPVSMFSLNSQLDVDADGTPDLELRNRLLITTDVPPSGWSGQVTLRLFGATRILGTSNEIGGSFLAVLPQALAVGASAQNLSWIGSSEAPFGVSVGSWSEGLNRPRTEWTGFAGAKDPVFGIELHSGQGVRYGWVRLRFSGGTALDSMVYIYDWAYESAPGVPIMARAGTGGVITPQPPFQVIRGPETFRVRLSGDKAVPPTSNPLTGTAKLILNGEQLACSVQFPPEAADAVPRVSISAIIESADEQRAFTLGHFVIYTTASLQSLVFDPSASDGYSGNISLTPTLADSIRRGAAHLKLVFEAGVIRGQVARPFSEVQSETPLAGEYSLLLRPPAVEASEENRPFPKGVGHGRLHIAENRDASLTLTLPLGSGIRWNGTLDENDTIHVTAKAAAGLGNISGAIQVAQQGSNWVCTGELVWTRPANDDRVRFPAGFKIPLTVQGSKFDRSRERAENSALTIAHGGLPSPITVDIKSTLTETVLTSGQLETTYTLDIAGANPHRVTLVADPETGVFRGSFRHPRTGVRVSFAGRILGDLSGAGSFVSGRRSGVVSIEGLQPAEGNTSTLPPASTLPFLSGAILGPSPTDPDVVMVSASGLVPDTSYELELIPHYSTATPADGVYDVILNRYKASELGLTVITTRSTTGAFLRPPGFRGIRIHHALGSTVFLE